MTEPAPGPKDRKRCAGKCVHPLDHALRYKRQPFAWQQIARRRGKGHTGFSVQPPLQKLLPEVMALAIDARAASPMPRKRPKTQRNHAEGARWEGGTETTKKQK